MDRSETQSLERGLAVLACLAKAGALTAAEVAQRTRLSVATVRRLLNTLHAAGYVSQARSHQPYRMTLKIAALAALIPQPIRIAEAARQAIAGLPRSYPWPVAFMQWDGAHLVVRETTPERPRLEPTHYISGWRLKPPFGASAFILAAGGTPEMRASLLHSYRASKLQKAKRQLDAFEAALSTPALRKSSAYVLQTPNRSEFSIAVPVLMGSTCLGALETRVVSGAIAKATDKQKVIAVLEKCAAHIGDKAAPFD